MREKTLRVSIKGGKVSFTVEGVKGEACVDETKFLEEALGGDVLERELTGEYYEAQDAETVTTRRGG